MPAALLDDGPANPPPALDVRKADSLAQIHASLDQLARQEASVTAQLDALIASQNDLSRELGRLDLLRAQLGTQLVNTRAISNGMLRDAASTARRISSAVEKLDREQENVKATLQVVEQVAELKACVLGVVGSMGAPQDWETAAGYLSRASSIPDSVIDGPFAEEIVPTAEVPDPPRITLDNAAESLCTLFLREFEKATKEADGTKVTRFFKLFPLIGRSNVGLEAYGRYVCQGVSARARTNLNAGTGGAQSKDGFFYANALTKLFEHIAQIVDGHQPLVERHYGAGMMVKVIERLQIEADVQGGITLDTWSEERKVDRRLTDLKSYAFSFLVQSFLPAQKPSAGILRSETPTNRSGTPGGRTSISEDDGVDMKEIDGLLNESGMMLSRWALYTRFLASKSQADTTHESQVNGTTNGTTTGESLVLTLPPYLANSNLQKKVSNLLIEPFNSMMTFFFRRSVEKAFQLDEQPSGLTSNMKKPIQANPPFITSAVDDVMYVLNQVLQRSLATSQRAVVANVIPFVGGVLSSDFIGMIQRKMRDECYPKAAIQGAPPPEDKIIAFLVLINSLDISTEYFKRIMTTQLEPPTEDGTPSDPVETMRAFFPFNHDTVYVATQLQNIQSSFRKKATDLMGDGINVIFHQVLKPRLRPSLSDTFRDVDYNISSSTGANDPSPSDDSDSESADLVPSRFSSHWSILTKPLKRLMTPLTYEKLLTTALPYLSAALEKRLWSLHGRVSELGAVRLERDVAGIVAVACGEGKYALRAVFARCVQIVMVAGMEGEEWEEVRGVGTDGGGQEEEGGVEWVLSLEERGRARGLVAGR